MIFLFTVLVSTSALAPPPVNFEREFVQVGDKSFIVEWKQNKMDIRPTNRVKEYLRQEFYDFGFLIILFLGAFFWIGVWAFFVGDYWRATYLFSALFLVLMAMVYAFKE